LQTKAVPGSAAVTARSGSSKPPSRNALQGGGMPEIQTPQNKPATGASRDPIDKSKEKNYGENDKIDGLKTTLKITGDKGATVNVDGHKIYDPSHPPLSSNPKAQYRFSDPTYRSTGGDVYFGENVGTAFHEVRKGIHGKSLYVGEVRVDNVLDLSDTDVVRQMNIDAAKITAKVDDVVAQKKVYGYTNQIANQAYDAGYSGIFYPSSRKAGSNAVVLFEGRYDPKAIKPILDVSIQ
jgi:RES domain-containing protein